MRVQTSKLNKSAEIRELLHRRPAARPREIAAILRGRGINVTLKSVYNVKAMMKLEEMKANLLSRRVSHIGRSAPAAKTAIGAVRKRLKEAVEQRPASYTITSTIDADEEDVFVSNGKDVATLIRSVKELAADIGGLPRLSKLVDALLA